MYTNPDKLYTKIRHLNKTTIVTVDSLLEGHSYGEMMRITDGLQKLRSLGLITIKSIRNHGRFETELIPKDGYVYHEPKKESRKVRKFKENFSEDDIDIINEVSSIDEASKEFKKEKVVIQKVRRKS